MAAQQASPSLVLIRFLEEPHRVSQFKLNLFSVSAGGLNLNHDLSLLEGEGLKDGA